MQDAASTSESIVSPAQHAEASAPTGDPTVTPQHEAISQLASLLVGNLDMTLAQRMLRLAMHREALRRSHGSRRAAAKLLGVDRRYVQRLINQS